MRRTYFLWLGVAFLATAALLWLSQTQDRKHFGGGGSQPARSDPGRQLSLLVSSVTGLAMSPLMATGAVGAYSYFQAEGATRPTLPWFAQPWFWIPALLLTGAVFAKDALGIAVPPGMKKPFDAIEVLENKLSGLFAAGALVPLITMIMAAGETGASASGAATRTLAHAGLLPAEFAALPGWVWSILLTPFALAVFGVVWIVSHAITILVLISPFPAVDAALKAARTSVLGLVAVTAAIDPWTAALLSVAVILISTLLVGWAFRLTVFGTVFTWDVLGRRWRRSPDLERAGLLAFAGRRLAGVPRRTLGRVLSAGEGTWLFRYRPWLVFTPRETSLPAGTRLVGRGLFYPDLRVTLPGRGKAVPVVAFPPRYRTHERQLGTYFGAAVEDTGVLKGLKAMWSWTLDAFGRADDAETQAAPARTPGNG